MSADATFAPSRSVERCFALGLLVLFVAVSVGYGQKVSKTARDGELRRSAILRWLPQLEMLDAGHDIYYSHNFPYPPLMALALSPLAKLPPLAAALTWYYVKVALTFLALAGVFRLVEGSGQTFPTWAKGVAVLLSLVPIVGDFSHGNVNLLILFLVVTMLSAFASGRDFLAGLLLALAIACKVTPALFVPYFVWKRAWGLLAGCVVGLPLFFVVVPGAILGQERNAELLQSWVGVMVKPYLVDGVVTPEHQNQSLPGVVYRLTTHHPAFSTYIKNPVTGVDEYTPVSYRNAIDIGKPAAGLLLKGCMVLFALLAVWCCRTPTAGTANRANRAGWRPAAEYGLVLVGMLLFSERTWKHHAVTLIVPFAVLAYAAAVVPLRPAVRTIATGTMTLSALLMALTNEAVLGKHGSDLAQVYGTYTLMFTLVAAALAALLRGPTADHPAASLRSMACSRGNRP